MPLQHTHRPLKVDEFYGSDEAIRSLCSVLARDETKPHAFLITGPSGVGKTTIARIIGNELKCDPDDMKELDTADFRGIDTIRAIKQQSRLKPMNGPARLFLLDECHQISGDGQEALLKTLEDAPPTTYFCLATTEPQKLKPTLKRRCHLVDLQPLDNDSMKELITGVLKVEQVMVPKEAVQLIVQSALGSPGIALSLLDAVIDLPPEEMAKSVTRREAERDRSYELCKLLIGKGGKTAWPAARELLKGLKDEEPERIRRHLMGYAQSVLLNYDNPQAGLVLIILRDHTTYDSGFPGLVACVYEIIFG